MKVRKSVCLLLVLLNLASGFTIHANPGGKDRYPTASSIGINPDSIIIARDKWGVPHIFAKTDAEVAYGFAWAQCEDHFQTTFELLFASKGVSGRWQGVEGAKKDFFAGSLQLDRIVEEKWDTDVSPVFKDYLNAFAAGINDWVKAHPDEVPFKKAFPISPKDILKGYMLTFSVLSRGDKAVEKIIEGKYDQHETMEMPDGSNAFAFNSRRTADGSVYLVVNPHQPLDGPTSFYEAHLCSEEGLNVLGGLFPGGTSIFLGTNENLGWTHTFNGLDLVDVFKLEMHPDKKNYYRFDGEWLKLDKVVNKLRVKVKKALPPIPVRKTSYWSVYGPTYKSKDGQYYAIRLGAIQTIKAAEQWYRMNKARNFHQFRKALEMQGLARFNIVYADRYDTIYYLNNGLIPKRNPGYNWAEVVPGNTSKTLWTEFYKIEELPQLLNPDCGYVFNTNNTPFTATCDSENIHGEKFPPDMGFWTHENNRSLRFLELMEEFPVIHSMEDIKTIKFDLKKPESGHFMEDLDSLLFSLDPAEYPDLAYEIRKLKNWRQNSRDARVDNKDAALLLRTAWNVIHDLGLSGAYTVSYGFTGATSEHFVKGLREAKDYLIKNFGTVDITLGDMQRIIRGDKDYPVFGFPDVLCAIHTRQLPDGRTVAKGGESYIQLVRFTRDSLPQIESLLAYGNSDRPESPHYNDQMELYINQQTRQMTLDKQTILKEAVKIYHPVNHPDARTSTQQRSATSSINP